MISAAHNSAPPSPSPNQVDAQALFPSPHAAISAAAFTTSPRPMPSIASDLADIVLYDSPLHPNEPAYTVDVGDLTLEESVPADKRPRQRPNPYSVYFCKFVGKPKRPPRVTLCHALQSAIYAAIGISALAAINFEWFLNSDLVMLVGSFGASAVLLYSAIESPLAQPRNAVFGNVISALIGVSYRKTLDAFIDSPLDNSWTWPWARVFSR
eukprot:NODE_3287_length_1246_cov_108.123776_g3121_i0.p1 GENE.NODE_3287_length_1246_cov_108.123776_g3121_i0~~NODE_3287_length_1246_cov_108.123776_g3121_i0.p1  ORF type:complete len:211 (+),score=8.98 NODE_3287_length_1246_cov_108.123776_g3121_i0:109-741(+)